MNDKNKIELGEFIYKMIGGYEKDAKMQDCDYESIAWVSINKIQELEQKQAQEDFVKGAQLGKPWAKAYDSNGNLVKAPDNDTKSPDPTTKPLLCVCNNQIGVDQQDNGHICGVCYQVYCGGCLGADFDTCQDCRDAGRIRKLVRDKNGNQFYTGCTLRNESSLTTSVKILQINETHIVTDPGGCIEIQDFIDGGWIVHERVTGYRTDKSDTICIEKCKFTLNEIGSLQCRECEFCKGRGNHQQWVICELYNNEAE